MKKNLLTIFTPTYNRGHLLTKLYQSLCRQTNTNFIWLVIDDGSIDDTRELIKFWIDEKKLSIHYAYKENGGMHTAHNLAYELIDTELNTCIDSDDYMPDNAVELIIDTWRKRGSDQYAGIIGLDITESGELIGTQFDVDITTLSGFYAAGGRGDKKLVYRTSLMKNLPPYPVFKGEKYVGLGYKYLLADQTHQLITLNEPLVIVEYQQSGSSCNIIRQKINNPKGFAFFHAQEMRYNPSLKRKIIASLHLNTEVMLQKRIDFWKDSPNTLLSMLTFSFSLLLLSLYLYKSKNNITSNEL